MTIDPGSDANSHLMRSILATLAAVAMLTAALPAHAGAWSNTKDLIKRRPVAVFVAVPAFIITFPFMLGSGYFSSDDEDDE